MRFVRLPIEDERGPDMLQPHISKAIRESRFPIEAGSSLEKLVFARLVSSRGLLQS